MWWRWAVSVASAMPKKTRTASAALGLIIGLPLILTLYAQAPQPAAASTPGVSETKVPAPANDQVLLTRYCATCHNDRLKTAGLSLAGLNPADAASAPEIWEKVARKL